jgi:hypothetical protein
MVSPPAFFTSAAQRLVSAKVTARRLFTPSGVTVAKADQLWLWVSLMTPYGFLMYFSPIVTGD